MIIAKNEISDERLQSEMAQIAKRLNVSDPEKALYFPKFFQIETIRICNARCPFCAIDQWDKSVPLMSDNLFNKIVDEMKDYSDWIEFVAVQRAGEPLLDKKLPERIKQLKDVGIKRVSIATNASMLTEDKAYDILKAGLNEIMLSIDSIEKEAYEKMRRGLNYETVIKNIENFFKIREEVSPDMVVRVRGVSYHDMKDEKDRDEVRRWESFWSRFSRPQDRIYMKQAHNWGNQKTWEGHSREYGEIYHPCIIPWSTMHVTAMGKVPLCPQDYDAKMNIGDINTQSIQEVWQSENWNRIREAHRSGGRNEISFCQGCKLFDLDFSMEKWEQKELYEG